MLRKLTFSVMTISMLQSAAGQASAEPDTTKKEPVLTISGGVDVYYRYDPARTKTNNLTSFTGSHNSFELGMATVKLNYKTDKTEVVADLGFGKRAQEFSSNDEGLLAGIKQLYISYTPYSWLKLTAGSWATHVGYELVDPIGNRNYSMSYLFTNGPFFHTGVRADLSFKQSGLMIGIANPTDFKYVPAGQLNSKFLLAQYSYAPGDFLKIYANYVGGTNVDTTKTDQYDLVLTSKISDKFSLGYNGTINRTKVHLGNKTYQEAKNWWGSALYVQADVIKNTGLTLRGEYFSDQNQLKVYKDYLKGGRVFATTLSATIRVDHLVIIPELRVDKASEPLFTKRSGTATKTAGSALLALVYSF